MGWVERLAAGVRGRLLAVTPGTRGQEVLAGSLVLDYTKSR